MSELIREVIPTVFPFAVTVVSVSLWALFHVVYTRFADKREAMTDQLAKHIASARAAGLDIDTTSRMSKGKACHCCGSRRTSAQYRGVSGGIYPGTATFEHSATCRDCGTVYVIHFHKIGTPNEVAA